MIEYVMLLAMLVLIANIAIARMGSEVSGNLRWPATVLASAPDAPPCGKEDREHGRC